MIEEVEALTEDVEEEEEEEEVEVVEEKREEEEEMMEEVELEDVEEEATEEVEEEDMIEEVELEDVDEEMIKVVTEEVKEELEEMIEEEEEEEEEGTSCYKRVHRDNDVKCHFDIGEFVGPDASSFLSPTLPATAATSLDDTKNILVALESGVPVMKILQAGAAGEWVEHRYAEDCWGWTFLDVCAFEERLYAVTTHGRIAEVEFAGDGGVNVELLESEAFEEEEETACGVEKMAHHIFDVVTDTDSHVLELAADARGNIRKVTVYW